jgi:hypothetical protein
MSPEPILPCVKSYLKPTDTKWARMGSWLLALLTFNFALLISACGLDIEDPTPPSPPVWIQKSLPEEWPERGIDAHESGGIYLEWEQNQNEDIVAYLVYRAENFQENDSLGDYELLIRLDSESGTTFEYLDRSVSPRIDYYYKLKSEDPSDNQSTFSDSLRYSLLPSLPASMMTPNGSRDKLSITRQLSWNYNYHIEMEDYCLTILGQNDEYIIRTVFSPTSYTYDDEVWYIPESVDLEVDQVYKWRIDTGAKYVNDYETAGSESPWATFLYIGT